jgi:release factor glutamine methyltransferase
VASAFNPNPQAATLSVRAALKEAIARLAASDVPSHTLAAELLLMHTLGRDRAWLYSHPEESLDIAAAEKYFAFVARRAAGEPTQYLTGTQEFWGLAFEVTPAVLIPRPETEHVVEVALERLRANASSKTQPPGAPLRIADVGTGSGCIAIALAGELPHAEIFAIDISHPALEVARRNAARHNVAHRIRFLSGNLLDPLLHDSGVTNNESRPFDLIVSNPPYVARRDAADLPREVRDHEPEAALFGGATGPEIYSALINQAAMLLRHGGILVLELGYDSAPHVREIFERDLRWSSVSITLDLAGIERVLAAQRT